ncbi:Wdr82 [Symbiodinium microadriaticum]|nr:Wdr82 [Symbiodinium microadriaticum]
MAAPSRPTAKVKLSDGLVQSLAVGKVYRDHKGPVSGMDFTYDGQHLVTSGEDKSVYVYSCEKAGRVRHLRCEKYGVGLIRFLHNDRDCAVAASRSEAEHLLKYWDFHDNKYLRLFRSHTARVTSVSPHPYEDLFLSGSEDRAVLLWDLRQERPVAKINGQGTTIASFDQQGLVFAACVGQPKLHLFDTRNYAKGEFTSFDLRPHVPDQAQFVAFSPCGKYLLARTRSQMVLIDAFDGELICEYPEEAPQTPSAASAAPVASVPSFSPDSQYVLSGQPNGDVCVWATTNARLVHRLEGHTTTPGRVLFSPAHALVVTAAELRREPFQGEASLQEQHEVQKNPSSSEKILDTRSDISLDHCVRITDAKAGAVAHAADPVLDAPALAAAPARRRQVAKQVREPVRQAEVSVPFVPREDPASRPFWCGRWPGARNDYEGEAGFRFLVHLDCEVTALGRPCEPPLMEAAAVSLWHAASQDLLASISVGPASRVEGSYAWERLPEAIVLRPGHEYRLTLRCRANMQDRWSDATCAAEEAAAESWAALASFLGGACKNANGFPSRTDGDLRRPGIVNFKALLRPPAAQFSLRALSPHRLGDELLQDSF